MGGRTIPSYDDLYLGYIDEPWDDYQDPVPTVGVQSLTGPHATVAEVYFDGLVAAGDAKRNNGERTRLNVGRDLAIGRALVELGNQLIDRAYDALGPE